ncbi:TlpA family protein disulfide reductase [Telmatocola sphagniphila]|uniref:TlpA family protein disulfide reductase n=1 Tax=Telmatocola sphagniphila TaxID=1123043 RepID=A0A8E6EU96_9BACT|nr:TlpA disulfide reductase family protein [Telmatocola sphagniphila]QVL31105.1 TlpA family protein disulfide reductase [Telmatocola sphagniphila]
MKRLALWLFLLSGLLAGCDKSANAPVGVNSQDMTGIPKEAQQKLEAHDVPGALQILDETLVKEPNNLPILRMALSLSQDYASQQSKSNPEVAYPLMKKSAGYLRSLKKVDKTNIPKSFEGQVFYNEACAFARENKKEEALASLNDCLASGFEEVELLDTDEDLNSIRELPEFKAIVPKFKEKLLVVAKESARATIDTSKPFDFDFNLKTIEGKPVALSDYAGKVLIVDFWGTWCPPCRMEIPHFIELHKKYRDKGFEIVGINYESGSEAEVKATIKNFADAEGITYPCVIGDKATTARVPNFRAYPTTLFIDRAGKVRAMLVGLHPLAELEALVTILLDEKK